MGWKIIEHTADAGFEAEAPSWCDLFALAAEAFYSLCLEQSLAEGDGKAHSIKLEAIDMEELAVSWINELLFLLETRRLVFRPFYVRVSDDPCALFSEGEAMTSRQERLPVKSATYGGLVLRKTPSPFLRMFLDM